MKYVITILLFAFSHLAFSQNNSDLITYQLNGVYMEFYNDAGEKVTSKPIGKNVYIGVNEFFKSYTIIYDGENGNSESISFSYISDMKDGMMRMKDKYDNIFYLADYLKTDKKLIVVSEKKAENLTFLILFK